MALKPICRLGDPASGLCLEHSPNQAWTGNIDTATAGFTSDGFPVAAVGDEGYASCGHRFRITSGSSVCTGVGGKIVARKDDQVTMILPGRGTGTLTWGSPNVSSE